MDMRIALMSQLWNLVSTSSRKILSFDNIGAKNDVERCAGTVFFILGGQETTILCSPQAEFSWRRPDTAVFPKPTSSRGRSAPPLEKPIPKDGKFISLPPPVEISVPPLELRSAIESRRSIRQYTSDPLTLEELAYLLWCTQGIVQKFAG
jgi:hypothetical protein